VPRPKFTQWSHTLAQPKLGALVVVFFFATFCFTCFEATFPLLARDKLGFGAQGQDHRIGYLFTYCGLVTALLQGGGIGKLVKKLVVLGLLAIGSGLNRPPVFGMISLNSPANEQGANLGVAQSFGSLARIFSPMFATTLFFVKPQLPYVICGGFSLLTAFFAWQYLCRGSAPSPAQTATPGKPI